MSGSEKMGGRIDQAMIHSVDRNLRDIDLLPEEIDQYARIVKDIESGDIDREDTDTILSRAREVYDLVFERTKNPDLFMAVSDSVAEATPDEFLATMWSDWLSVQLGPNVDLIPEETKRAAAVMRKIRKEGVGRAQDMSNDLFLEVHKRLSRVKFELKAVHIALLKAANITWLSEAACAFDGAPGIDPREPFGSGGIASMLELVKTNGGADVLGDPEATFDKLARINDEMVSAIQVVLQHHNLESGEYPEGMLTDEQIKLLESAHIRSTEIWNEGVFDHTAAFDAKKPYGNSDVLINMLEIIGRIDTEQIQLIEADGMEAAGLSEEELYEEMQALQKSLVDALKIVLRNHEVNVGRFDRDPYDRRWKIIS